MIDKTEENRIKKLCNHEAGHLLLSKLFLFRTNGLCLEVNQQIGHTGEAVIILSTSGINSIPHLVDYPSSPKCSYKCCKRL